MQNVAVLFVFFVSVCFLQERKKHRNLKPPSAQSTSAPLRDSLLASKRPTERLGRVGAVRKTVLCLYRIFLKARAHGLAAGRQGSRRVDPGLGAGGRKAGVLVESRPHDRRLHQHKKWLNKWINHGRPVGKSWRTPFDHGKNGTDLGL